MGSFGVDVVAILSSQVSATHYGNGVTTTFPFAFMVPFGALVVTVTVGKHSRTLQHGYTVTGYDRPEGGHVSFGTAPELGALVTLERRVSLLQQLDVPPGGMVSAAEIESGLDRLTMVDLQQQGYLDRSIKGPSYEYPRNTVLPAAEERANRLLAFDHDGGVTVSSLSLSQIEAGIPDVKIVQQAQVAGAQAEAACVVLLALKADFDQKYADFSAKYETCMARCGDASSQP